MGSVMSPNGSIGADYVLDYLANLLSEKDLFYFEPDGKPVDEWLELNEKMRKVIKNNPIDGLIDMEEHKDFIIDRFVCSKLSGEQGHYFVEISRSLLEGAPSSNG